MINRVVVLSFVCFFLVCPSCIKKAKQNDNISETNYLLSKDNRHKSEIIEIIKKVNAYWQSNNRRHVPAFWNTAVYHMGNVAAYEVTGIEEYKKYSEVWIETCKEESKIDSEKENVILLDDWETCLELYVDFYNNEADKEKIGKAKGILEARDGIGIPENGYFHMDAVPICMLMALMTKIYKLTGEDIYLEKTYNCFSAMKKRMYDEKSGFFYCDSNYIYPHHKTSSGFKDFRSKTNSFLFAALAKITANTPPDDPHRIEYINVYKKMAELLTATQQEEGYWTQSIMDPDYLLGQDTSSTAFFVYGLLWGINNGILDENKYLPIVNKGWRYLTETALQTDGEIAYIQHVDEESGQFDSAGDEVTADFVVGAFLLAASEMVKCLK